MRVGTTKPVIAQCSRRFIQHVWPPYSYSSTHLYRARKFAQPNSGILQIPAISRSFGTGQPSTQTERQSRELLENKMQAPVSAVSTSAVSANGGSSAAARMVPATSESELVQVISALNLENGRHQLSLDPTPSPQIQSQVASEHAEDSIPYKWMNGMQISALDTRHYRPIRLGNGLRVLLVSDMESDKAAAALDVAVGHFSDPEDIPGLAHFCEHMLFLGTEKYPDESSYRQFLSENGGYSNAYTSMENTNYHFHIVKNKFKEALDRFSQFFISPLFTESATEREANAVDSEHQKNIQSDAHRLFQLHKSMASNRHPYHKFGTGSLKTLFKDKNPDEVRKRLLEFHQRYYSANQMHLCVVAPEELDVLEEWVKSMFEAVPNLDSPSPCVAYMSIPVFERENLAKKLYVSPVKDIHLLEMIWITDSFRETYRTKPAQYIAHMLGHEGRGSLLSLLKSKGWADGLSAGPGRSTDTFGTFDVSVELTSEGLHHTDEVAAIVFGYLQLLREGGIADWVYEECRDVAAMAFRFQEREEPIKLATRITAEMRYFPSEHWLSGSALYFEFSRNQVEHVLDKLSPESVWMCVVGRAFGDTMVLDQREPWYETPFALEVVSPEKIARWKSMSPETALHLPLRNKFIPTDFSLLPPPSENQARPYPIRIRDDDRWRVHFKQDTTFRRPKTNLYFELLSPMAYYSPRNAALTNLFTQLLVDDLNEFSYDAEIAGLHYGLSNIMTGMRFALRGYNHRILVLFEAIIEKMASFKINEERFQFILASMQREYTNFFMEQPYQHAMYAFSYCTEVPRWHIRDYVEVSKTLTVKELNNFIPSLFDRMFVEMLAHGNITKEEALGITEVFDRKIPFKRMYNGEYPERRVAELPMGSDGVIYRQVGPNKDDSNSSIEVHFQTTFSSIRSDVILELFGEVLNKPCFHQLRTVEQLGYLVFSGIQHIESSQGVRIIVQSTVAAPNKLDERIELFLKRFREDDLENLTEADLRVYIDSLITLKLEKDKRLTQQTNRWWSEIEDRRYQYDRPEREVEALRTVTKVDLLELFDNHISQNAPYRRKFSSQVYGKQHPVPQIAGTDSTGSKPRAGTEEDGIPSKPFTITDPIRFRNSCKLLPVYMGD